jgi:hypothetical protein
MRHPALGDLAVPSAIRLESRRFGRVWALARARVNEAPGRRRPDRHLGTRPSSACPGRYSKPAGRTISSVRSVRNPLGFLLAGLAIGYLLARPLSQLIGERGRNEIAVDFPPGSEREKQWRLRRSGLEGTSRTAL